jgi:hypothetical protein
VLLIAISSVKQHGFKQRRSVSATPDLPSRSLSDIELEISRNRFKGCRKKNLWRLNKGVKGPAASDGNDQKRTNH